MDKKFRPRVSVVVNSFNRRQYAIELFAALRKQDYPQARLEYILVDGGGTDGTDLAVRKKFPFVKVIRTEENIGHSACLNLGQNAAKGEIIVVFDSDALPPDGKYLSRLVGKFADKRVFFLAPKIINYFSRKVMWDNAMHSRKPVRGKAYDCSIFNGASYGIRKKLVQKAGGYDPEFFLMLEEQFYSMKLRDEGFPLSYFSDVAILHRMPPEADFRPGRNRRTIRNTIMWCCKYLPWKYVLLTGFGVGALFLQVAKGRATSDSFQGAAEGISNIPHYLTSRGKILKEETVKYFFRTKTDYTNKF